MDQTNTYGQSTHSKGTKRLQSHRNGRSRGEQNLYEISPPVNRCFINHSHSSGSFFRSSLSPKALHFVYVCDWWPVVLLSRLITSEISLVRLVLRRAQTGRLFRLFLDYIFRMFILEINKQKRKEHGEMVRPVSRKFSLLKGGTRL